MSRNKQRWWMRKVDNIVGMKNAIDMIQRISLFNDWESCLLSDFVLDGVWWYIWLKLSSLAGTEDGKQTVANAWNPTTCASFPYGLSNSVSSHSYNSNWETRGWKAEPSMSFILRLRAMSMPLLRMESRRLCLSFTTDANKDWYWVRFVAIGGMLR
jgi:hypothetical protein